jgi:hypothetical protein
MFGMNQEQIKSAVVKLLAIVGAFIAGKWGITSGTWEAISGVVLAVVTLLFSFKMNTSTAIVKAAEAMPQVTHITVSDKAIADATGPKVTT